MKKYILMLAVAAATALVACGNKEAQTEEVAVDSVAVEEVVDTVAPCCADSCAADSAVVAE